MKVGRKHHYSTALLKLLLLPTLLFGASFVHGVTFKSGIDTTDWQLQASQFECRLSQSIPDFGMAVFTHKAGESIEFSLNSAEKVFSGRETTVLAESPAWMPGTSSRTLGEVKTSNTGALKVTQKLANEVLVSLYKGQTPTFNNSRWHGTSEHVKVAISAVNFQAAYKNYKECVSGLLPVNYRQIARSAVLFPGAQWRLSDATKKRLELIAQYIKADPEVTAIYVDGHSDNLGRRLANRDLSRQRAEEVSRYLTKLGVNEDMLTTRYHGERYPVVKNVGEANRARNRRVTIRLEREG